MIRRFIRLIAVTLAAGLAASGGLRAETTNPAPDFKQVYDLLRANLPGMTDAGLNAVAVTGLLSQLHGRATLVGGPAETIASAGQTALIKSAVLESNVAYLHVGQVEDDLANQLSMAYHALTATNKVVGMALDLRFADGNDYAAAVAAADLFLTKKMPLLKWSDGIESSQPAREPIPGPLMVLVNGETTGAAEALAAALREADAGLIIGNPTAGLAMTTVDFPLKNGEHLRIATNPVKLGNGAVISHVSPDIAVTVSPADERAYLKNPYLPLAQNDTSPLVATNDFLSFVDHTSEADLVREKLKDGDDSGTVVPAHSQAPPKPVIQDPVLARAVDLIKGLAIVHESRL
ncbi:MAG TPA: S41 family peptidase [Candidatus Sulfopaludibacter sp.]|nr:S41 family peptidase [Candidatus Sulfopaludibacter sp.]